MALKNKNIKNFSGAVSVEEYFHRARDAWQNQAMNSGVQSIQAITRNLEEAGPLSEEDYKAVWDAVGDSH